jgi:hypoxanthine-DNA glycosylase
VNNCAGFAPIADKNAKILILGSMPSETSLSKQQYYGHERNAFWPIMESLFNADARIKINNYKQRQNMIIENNIAVWDVLKSCYRKGSLDTAIKMNSIQTNDFYSFFSTHQAIRKVFFNGAKAETIYKRYVLNNMSHFAGLIKYNRLPSTSPAYATMTLQQKSAAWSKAIKGIVG